MSPPPEKALVGVALPKGAGGASGSMPWTADTLVVTAVAEGAI